MNKINKMNSIFKSKRNRVWLENGCVHKLILTGVEAAQIEADILQRLFAEGVNVPKLLDLEGDKLIMEYVKGVTLTEEVEREIFEVEILAELISQWFASFYAAFPDRIRGDVNCRNFILAPDSRLYGIDFEDLPHGQKETDLGRLTAFILTYAPPYTEYKKRLAQSLTDCFCTYFSIDRAFALQEQTDEFEAMRKRRSFTLGR